jgi:hypothetical protein
MLHNKRFKISIRNKTIGYSENCKLHVCQKQEDFYKFQQCFRIKGFCVLQLSIANRQERESEQIMNLLLSETNFKARSIAQYIFGTCMLNVYYYVNVLKIRRKPEPITIMQHCRE